MSIYNVNEMLEKKRYNNNKWREVVFLENDTEYDTKQYTWKNRIPENQVWVISFRIYRNIQKPHESYVKIWK